MQQEFKQTSTKFQHYIFEPYQPEFIEECLDLLEDSYFTLNPIYIGLKMDKAEFREYQRPTFLDERCWKYSYVVMDTKDNNKIVGMQIIKDVAFMNKKPEVFGNAKKDFKEVLDNSLYAPIHARNYEPGECTTCALWCVDPKAVRGGLGFAMCAHKVRILYRFNIKTHVNIIYNRSSLKLAMAFGGEIGKKIILNDMELEGQKIYADNKDQAHLHVLPVNDEMFLKSSKQYNYSQEQFMQIKRKYRIDEDQSQYQLKQYRNQARPNL